VSKRTDKSAPDRRQEQPQRTVLHPVEKSTVKSGALAQAFAAISKPLSQ